MVFQEATAYRDAIKEMQGGRERKPEHKQEPRHRFGYAAEVRNLKRGRWENDSLRSHMRELAKAGDSTAKRWLMNKRRGARGAPDAPRVGGRPRSSSSTPRAQEARARMNKRRGGGV